MALPNYKPAQPLALRQLNQKFELDPRNKQKRNAITFTPQFKESAEQLALEFGRKSSIHGLNKIFQENSNIYERFFWLLVLVYALLGSIYVCMILSQRFNAGTFQTVVDRTNAPVFHIAFPEISICNANHLNWKRLEEAKQQFMPHENDTEKIRMFETVIGLYDNVSFGEFDAFSALEDKPVELVNSINFSLVFDFMTWRCEEFLTDCVWRHYKLNCCDIFLRSKGQEGLCWHFNTLNTDEARRKQLMDDKYPWRTGSAGPKSGLNVRLLLNEDKHYYQDNEKGVTVAVLEPGVFHRDPIFVPANTETVVEVEPVVYFYDNGTRSVSSAQRKCRFNDEPPSFEYKNLPGFPYMLENCHSQCYQEYLLRYCNCTMDILFPPAQYNACKAKDLLCLAKNNDYFQFTHQSGEEEYMHSDYQGMICNCFRNCYSLNYVADVRPSFLPEHLRRKGMHIDLDIHYRIETMFVYRTSLVFSWVNLVVAFGGIVGLFLGCSLISGIELLYFVFIELPRFLLNEWKSKGKSKNIYNQLNKEFKINKIPLKRRKRGVHSRTSAAENFGDNSFSVQNNNFSVQNAAVQLWSQQYYLTNKHNC
ncbi:pickpocket protein 19-like [Calliphora vicina]|uniref:pickpocket protein 19-like n=1 Tax=Calliphora vicina TaxID=7373 RepID=UPI00325B21FD